MRKAIRVEAQVCTVSSPSPLNSSHKRYWRDILQYRVIWQAPDGHNCVLSAWDTYEAAARWARNKRAVGQEVRDWQAMLRSHL